VLEEQCASAALCDPSGGACVAPACAAGERRCEGAALQICNSARSGFVLDLQCRSAAECNAETGTCGAVECAAGERRCRGRMVEQCSADRSRFEPLQDCGSPRQCNQAAGSCNICVPGARRCADASTAAVCDASGQSESSTACGLLEGCQGGECRLLGAL
jgi:hypothetical protein